MIIQLLVFGNSFKTLLLHQRKGKSIVNRKRFFTEFKVLERKASAIKIRIKKLTFKAIFSFESNEL